MRRGPVPIFVSTGALPPAQRVRDLLVEAHESFRDVADGDVSTVYPALAEAPPGLFGICVVGTNGESFAVGDAEVAFPIMSVAKPFLFALVAAELGPDEARSRIGVNATGLPFNSVEAIERSADGRTNPMVNPGAIATAGLVPGAGPVARWTFVHDGLSAFAGRRLQVDERIYASASATNDVNRGLVAALAACGAIAGDSGQTLDLYTRQCCLSVTARDLATMGATLADGGVNPVTGERVVDEESCRCTLAVMATAGLYETSGDWLCDVGLPGKSGIGGGIVTVSPGKGGLGSFAPPLDRAGNSVRGQLAARFVSRSLGLDVFASQPHA